MVSEFQTARDRHLFGPGPKKILSLGGSGNSGNSAAIFIAFLERLERIVSEKSGKQTRLADYFDLIGGTSIGAVTAAAIALGYEASQLKDFLLRFAPFAMKSVFWRIPLLQPRFDAEALRVEIRNLVGDRTLETSDLVTGLCVVTKRIDTGSPWVLSNNPRAAYWQGKQEYIGNKDYPLANLLRASMAAPHYFDPELLPVITKSPLANAGPQPNTSWPLRAIRTVMNRFGLGARLGASEGEIDPDVFGIFVDGTASPHGNPSLALLQMATLPPLNLNWATGPERLTVCSIGAGRRRYLAPSGSNASGMAPVLNALTSLVTDAEDVVLSQMQYFGECPTPWASSAAGVSAHDAPQGGKICRFLHYDIKLEGDWLEDHIGEAMSSQQIARLQRLDDPTIFNDLSRIASIAAEKQLKPEHF